MWVTACFFRLEYSANALSQPMCEHLNGRSPKKQDCPWTIRPAYTQNIKHVNNGHFPWVLVLGLDVVISQIKVDWDLESTRSNHILVRFWKNLDFWSPMATFLAGRENLYPCAHLGSLECTYSADHLKLSHFIVIVIVKEASVYRNSTLDLS